MKEIKFPAKPPGRPANKKNFDGFRFILDVFRAAFEELVHACLDPGEFTVFSRAFVSFQLELSKTVNYNFLLFFFLSHARRLLRTAFSGVPFCVFECLRKSLTTHTNVAETRDRRVGTGP